MTRLIVIFDETGEAISDFKASDWADNAIATFLRQKPVEDAVFRVASALPIHYLRLRIMRGAISCEDVEFQFKGQILPPNKDGSVAHWPRGFCDHEEDVLLGLLGWDRDKGLE